MKSKSCYEWFKALNKYLILFCKIEEARYKRKKKITSLLSKVSWDLISS